MPPPSNGMSDTLPPSIIAGVPEAEAGPEVARNPAPAALPVGTIERMGHTIQHLQSQDEVLPIQSKPYLPQWQQWLRLLRQQLRQGHQV